MNLLLLLSALLSALTGAVPGVRRAEVPQAVAQGLVTAKVRQAAVAPATMRPVTAIPSLPAVAGALPLRVQAPIAAPIWMDRRRE